MHYYYTYKKILIYRILKAVPIFSQWFSQHIVGNRQNFELVLNSKAESSLVLITYYKKKKKKKNHEDLRVKESNSSEELPFLASHFVTRILWIIIIIIKSK